MVQWLVALLSDFRSGHSKGGVSTLQKAVSPISPRHHQLAPDSSEMWAAITRNSSSSHCQRFPPGALTNPWARQGGGGQRWGARGQACYDLISVIVGHYVKCTSRLEFLHHASSFFYWGWVLVSFSFFPPQIPYLCRGDHLSKLFFSSSFFLTQLCFAFTLSHFHMEAAQSTTLYHWDTPQLGVNPPPPHCSFSFSSHTSRNTW